MFTTRIPVLASTTPQVYIGPVSPENLKPEPQDEDSIMIAWRQEEEQDGSEEFEHEQRPVQPPP